VKTRGAFAAVAALTIGGCAACASGQAATEEQGLPPGTAKITIDGAEVPTTHAVECAPAEQAFTTITTGDGSAGTTMMVSNAGKLTVEFVRIRNLNGFSGDYNRGLGDEATVGLSGTTYQISGVAHGFGPSSPEPTNVPFTIKLAC
jgi:ipoprotein LpqH